MAENSATDSIYSADLFLLKNQRGNCIGSAVVRETGGKSVKTLSNSGFRETGLAAGFTIALFCSLSIGRSCRQ